MNNNEPIVLGNVKKGKTGKPLVVVIVFLFIGSIVLFLPTIMNYFGDYSILDLIKNGELITFIQNHEEYMRKDNTVTTVAPTIKNDVLINSKTVIEYNNFTLNNFVLDEESVSFDINTSNNINFNESNYYLVLSKDKEELYNIKLVGEITGTDNYKFKFVNRLDSTVNIKGTVKEIKNTEYPEFTLPSDESGLASITCKKDNRELEYMFQHDKLISIKDEYTYNESDDKKYFDEFEKYNKLAETLNNLGALSTVEENISGFEFVADIDLSKYNYEKNVDFDYYSLDTKSNIVNFEMNSKGYDCE